MPAETRTLGAAALACYCVHAAEILLRFPSGNLLWSCDVAALMVAVGLLAGSALAVATGCIVLIVGEPLWVAGILGGELLPTAPLIHVGSLALGLVGLRRLGTPRGAGVLGVVVMSAATLAARIFAPPGENVNLAHAIPRGFAAGFASHGAYLAALGTTLAAGAVAAELALRRIGFDAARPAAVAGGATP